MYSWAESAEEADLDVGNRWSQTKTRRTGSRGGVNQDLRMFNEDLALDRQEGGTEQVLSLIYGRPMTTSGYIGNACVITWPRLPKNPCQKDAIMSKNDNSNRCIDENFSGEKDIDYMSSLQNSQLFVSQQSIPSVTVRDPENGQARSLML